MCLDRRDGLMITPYEQRKRALPLRRVCIALYRTTFRQNRAQVEQVRFIPQCLAKVTGHIASTNGERLEVAKLFQSNSTDYSSVLVVVFHGRKKSKSLTLLNFPCCLKRHWIADTTMWLDILILFNECVSCMKLISAQSSNNKNHIDGKYHTH